MGIRKWRLHNLYRIEWASFGRACCLLRAVPLLTSQDGYRSSLGEDITAPEYAILWVI